jgi:hypothetical protein
MYDLCEECFREHRAHGIYTPEKCDWCKEKASDIRPTRDYEEGMHGPVYYVCGLCRKQRDNLIREELTEYDDYDDYD